MVSTESIGPYCQIVKCVLGDFGGFSKHSSTGQRLRHHGWAKQTGGNRSSLSGQFIRISDGGRRGSGLAGGTGYR